MDLLTCLILAAAVVVGAVATVEFLRTLPK